MLTPTEHQVRETHPWSGRVVVHVLDEAGAVTESVEFENIITDAGKTLLAAALMGGTTPLEILYMAWGDDPTAPVVGDTTLGNETGRKTVTSQAAGGAAGEVDTIVYLGPADAVGDIEELGWFAGNATVTTDSGTLIAHTLYSRSKTNQESIQVSRTDDIG